MVIPKILVVAALAISAINADRIFRIEIRTADCDDCGMSNTFGDLRMQVRIRSFIIQISFKSIRNS